MEAAVVSAAADVFGGTKTPSEELKTLPAKIGQLALRMIF